MEAGGLGPSAAAGRDQRAGQCGAVPAERAAPDAARARPLLPEAAGAAGGRLAARSTTTTPGCWADATQSVNDLRTCPGDKDTTEDSAVWNSVDANLGEAAQVLKRHRNNLSPAFRGNDTVAEQIRRAEGSEQVGWKSQPAAGWGK
eukprot:scaffold214_cov249-Pinguiococcus_pyrenoidosus.AAC.1